MLTDWDGEWEESAIDARTLWLSNHALATWPRPEMDQEALDDDEENVENDDEVDDASDGDADE